MKSTSENCEACYKIICRQCGWEANDTEVVCIQRGEITTCPECGWSPRDIL